MGVPSSRALGMQAIKMGTASRVTSFKAPPGDQLNETPTGANSTSDRHLMGPFPKRAPKERCEGLLQMFYWLVSVPEPGDKLGIAQCLKD